MLSLCFSFKTVGLHPSLLQYSPSPWNNFSFELLIIGIEVFLCSSPGLWSMSGINIWVRHRGTPPEWEGRALSLLKEVQEYVRLCATPVTALPLFPRPWENCLCGYREIRGFHSYAQRKHEPVLPPEIKPCLLWKTPATVAEEQRLSFGARAASCRGGWKHKLGSQGPDEVYVFLHRENCYYFRWGDLYASTLWNCWGVWMQVIAMSQGRPQINDRKGRMWTGCKMASPSPFPPRWNADYLLINNTGKNAKTNTVSSSASVTSHPFLVQQF